MPPMGTPGAGPIDQTYTSFPAVKTEELLSVLQEMGLAVSAEDVAKPQSAMVQRVYMAFLDTLAGTLPDMLDARRDEACARMEHSEIFEDGIAWLLFYREVRAMMDAATVHDFHLQDLTRPHPKRFKRHMSALVNFFRFRSDRLAEFDELVLDTEELENRRLDLEEGSEQVRSALDALAAQRRDEEPQVHALRERNLALSDQLLRLKKEQGKLLGEVDALKGEKAQLAQHQSDVQHELHTVHTELHKLQARLAARPDDVRRQIADLHTQAAQERAGVRDAEAKAAALADKLQVLAQLDTDVAHAHAALEQIAGALERIARETRILDEAQHALAAHEEERAALEARHAELARETEHATHALAARRDELEAQRSASQARLDALTARLGEVSRTRKERHALAELRTNEAQAVEQEIESVLQAHEAHYAKMQRDKDALCRTAAAYMDALTRALAHA
ncbi:kinetochore-associated Ndc80 complex subunit nuf2 [Malassezia brasiliensis]|uniref:Kinetochore-associated Ndc80 complex subunit nuf2 n=1 Tax=Malassezia brasiliensis TaxID=1821822 RepID=A0AAF0DVJ2_9BASI|nr:kinetochore-associated Ndc80 complex subunit nuf2 [Malassezia brasiliensis]